MCGFQHISITFQWLFWIESKQRDSHIKDQLKISEFFQQISHGLGLSVDMRDEFKSNQNEFGVEDDKTDDKCPPLASTDSIEPTPDADVLVTSADGIEPITTAALAVGKGVMFPGIVDEEVEEKGQSNPLDIET
eukprot:886703_1